MPYDYPVRKPYPSELSYFRKNPLVSGMAAPDGRVVLNPFSLLSPSQKSAVVRNESVRLFLRKRKFPLMFGVTPSQGLLFRGGPYEGKLPSQKETIIGRILSGDKSMAPYTKEQLFFADLVSKGFMFPK